MYEVLEAIAMRFIVDGIPDTPEECYFSYQVKDVYRFQCKLTEGICDNTDECRVLIKLEEISDVYRGN